MLWHMPMHWPTIMLLLMLISSYSTIDSVSAQPGVGIIGTSVSGPAQPQNAGPAAAAVSPKPAPLNDALPPQPLPALSTPAAGSQPAHPSERDALPQKPTPVASDPAPSQSSRLPPAMDDHGKESTLPLLLPQGDGPIGGPGDVPLPPGGGLNNVPGNIPPLPPERVPSGGSGTGSTSPPLSLPPAVNAGPKCLQRKRMQQGAPVVDCHLEIYGHGPRQPGIKSLRLNCSSKTDPTYQLPIGVATGSPKSNPITAAMASVVAQQLRVNSQGMNLPAPGTLIPCQEQAEQPATSQDAVNLYALLYFCSGNVRFLQPVIRDVWLPFHTTDRATEDTAVVVFGGKVQATVVEGDIQGVNASTAIAVLGGAEVKLWQSRFTGNLGNPGSAVFARGDSVVKVVESTFVENNSSDFGGAIAVMDCATADVIDSNLTHNAARFSGGAIYADGSSSLLLRNVSMMHNQAGDGGAMYYRARSPWGDSWVNITNTTIAHNTAQFSGGGIQIYGSYKPNDPGSPSSTVQLQLSEDSIITNNSAVAGMGGGASLGHEVVFNTTVAKGIIVENKAISNNDVSVTPTALIVNGSSFVADFVARPSDGEGLLHVQLLLTGANGSIPCAGHRVEAYWFDGSSNIKELPSTLACPDGPADPNQAALPRALALSLQNGTVKFNLNFQQPPGNHTIFFLVPTEGALCPPRPVAANLTVNVRRCRRGEVEVKPGVCELCPPGLYSFEQSTQTCNPCPANADCPGGDVVVSRQGYWQSSVSSDQMHRCPNPKACAGNRELLSAACKLGNSSLCSDSIFVPSQCAAPPDPRQLQGPMKSGTSPYQGALCGKCAPGYGSIRPFQCTRCMNTGSLLAMYVAAGLAMLLYMKVLCHFALAESKERGFDPLLAEGSATYGKVQPTHLLRQLILHAQYTLIIASVQIGEAWPGSVSWAVKVLAWWWAPTSPEVLAPECLNIGGAMPPAVQKVVFYLVMPLLMMILLLVVEGIIMKAVDGSGAKRHVFNRLLAIVLVVGFFFLPSVARTAFSLFACVEIDKLVDVTSASTPKAVGWYFMLDLDQMCWSDSGWHKKFALGLGIPLCVLICFVPLGILLLMLRNRKRLKDPQFLQHFYFLVQYYRPKYCYWEAVVCAQTISLVAVSVFGYSLGPYNQALVMNVVVMLCGLLLLIVRPLAHREATKVAVASMVCLFLTSYTALTFAQYGTQSIRDPIPLYMGALVVTVNLLFVAWVLWQLAQLIQWKSLWQSCFLALRSLVAGNWAGCIAANQHNKILISNAGGTSKGCNVTCARPGSACCDASMAIDVASANDCAATSVTLSTWPPDDCEALGTDQQQQGRGTSQSTSNGCQNLQRMCAAKHP